MDYESKRQAVIRYASTTKGFKAAVKRAVVADNICGERTCIKALNTPAKYKPAKWQAVIDRAFDMME
jgi:hypothetical protein